MSKAIIDGPGEYLLVGSGGCSKKGTVVYFHDGYWYGHSEGGTAIRWTADGAFEGIRHGRIPLSISERVIATHAMAGGEFLEQIGGVE